MRLDQVFTCWGVAVCTFLVTVNMSRCVAGTEICADPELGLYTILLTNRVYPNDTDFRIEDVRRAFNNAVLDAVNKTTTRKLKV